MPAPKTGTDLLDLVRKSGLLEKHKIEGYVGKLQDEGSIESDPNRLASRLIKDGIVTVFQARQMLRGRYRGFFLGKYKVLEPIGSGGMADIYLCEHSSMRHKVAVKILPIEKLKDPSLLGRFRREAQAIASLNHTNIVRAFDLDHEGSLHYMVTEYIDGSDLQEFIKRNGPLAPDRAANYIAQAAAGLQHLHEVGLVHRDIKPGNLLLDRNGVVKLLDLGLARFMDVERQDNLTREFDDGRVLGTADYIAPEQSIKGSEVDIRADIYSLGGTFYFLLQGQAPFEGASVTQKLLFHQIKEPSPLPDSVPADLQELIRLMMRKKVDQRLQTPAEIVSALLPYLQQAYPPEESELPPRSSIFNSGPKTNIPKSATRLSSRLTAVSLSAGPLSGRMASANSGVHVALRSTPVSGVNVATKSHQPIPATVPEVVEDDEESINHLTAPSSPAHRPMAAQRSNTWLIIGCVVAILLLITAIVSAFLAFGKSDKKPTTTGRLTEDVVRPPGSPSSIKTTDEIERPHAPNVLAAVNLDPVTPKGLPPEKSLRVTSSNAEGTYRLIRNALLKGGSNSHIVVLDPEHQEQLEIDSAWGLKNVVIEAWPMTTQPVILRAPPLAEPNKPIIFVNSAAGIQFKGFVIDGQGRTNDLVQFSGPCEGSSLENIRCVGFGKSAVAISGAAGNKDKPIRLANLRATTANELDSVFRLENTELGKNQFILVERCRFEGPFHAAIQLAGAVDHLEISYNRFFKNHVALRYQPREGDPSAVTLQAVNNVFYEPAQAALYFDSPLPASQPGWTLRNNLFLNTPRIALVDKVNVNPPPDQNAQWIWSADREPNQPTIVPGGIYRFRKTFTVSASPSQATLDIGCKDSFKVWLNGTLVGSSDADHFTQRVFSFPVGKLLKTGLNVIAVEGSNHADAVRPDLGTSAALLVRILDSETGKSLVTTDTTWMSETITPENWHQTGFNDSSWKSVKAWFSEPASPPWKFAVWDTCVQASLGNALLPPFQTGGNVRDYQSWEGYPNVAAQRGIIEESRKDFGTNPADDATFLRYPRSLPLMKLGTNGRPVGYPQEK